MRQKTFLTYKDRVEASQTDLCECPVCHKLFRMSADSKYLIGNKHTCSWKCFRNYVKIHSKKERIK